MTADKLKQWIGLVGGMLSTFYLAMKANGVDVTFLDPDKLEAWQNFLTTCIPLILAFYGVYKNTFVITKKAKDQEDYLKEKGLK
ncbi:phage holin [Staphylococcus simulans]|uniref:phage holin n=1 Tax=Staphylococcus simulans TaxID=1286 RepID=UPI0030BB258E